MNQTKNNKKLKRELGLFSLIGLCVGATVGAGIFSTISEVALVAQSSLFLVLALFIGALLQIPGSFCYAELTSAYPVDGGHYIYFREAGFKLITFLFGWLTFLAIDGPSVAIMSLAIANYLSFFIDTELVFLKFFSVCVVVIFSYMHIKSVKFGGVAQAILTCIKILPFLIICGVGVFFFNPDLFLSQDFMGIQNNIIQIQELQLPLCLISAIAISSYAFDGLYAGCYVSGEINNPKKTLPIGLIASALIVMVLYVALSSAATGLMPIDDIASSTAPIADMVSRIPVFGNLGGHFIAVLAIVVIMGTISSCLLYMPRFEYAMAKDGLFFKIFSRVHPKYKTPYLAIILFASYVVFLMFFSDLSNLLGSLTIIVLLKNLIIYILIFKLRKKSDYHPTYKAPFKSFIPAIAIISTFLLLLFALFNSDIFVLCFNGAIILLGILSYFIFTYIQKTKSSN